MTGPLRRRRPRAPGIPAAIVLGACVLGTASGEIYKHQDENGHWVFSDRPQPGSIPTPASGGKHVESDRAGTRSAGIPGKRDLVERLRTADEPASPIQRCRQAVVKIDSEIGSGSGFFIADNGLILTNRHVVRPPEDIFEPERSKLAKAKTQLDRMKGAIDRQAKPCRDYTNRSDCERAHRNHRKAATAYRRSQLDLALLKQRMATASTFTVQLQDKTKLRASLVAVSSKHDIALLQLNGYRTPYIPVLTGRPLADAQTLYVIGSPLGIADQISSGDYTGIFGGLLGTNAKVLPGNSGGPMVTEDGRVVGVVTIKVTAGIDPRKAGLGFAIPIDAAFDDFPQLRP